MAFVTGNPFINNTNTLAPAAKAPWRGIETCPGPSTPNDSSTLASRPLGSWFGTQPSSYSTASNPLFKLQQNSAQQMLAYKKPAAPKKDEGNILQQMVNGAAHLMGDGVRAVSDGAGWVAGEVVKNNPLALASRGLSAGADLIGQKDAARFLGGLDKVSGAAGDLVHGAAKGLGELEARGIEGVGHIVADPIRTAQTVVRGVTHAAGEGVKTVSNGVGWVAGEVVANNPLALASRGLAAGADLIGQHDAAKVLGTVDKVSGAAGDLVHGGIKTVGQIEGGLIEGAGRVIADPIHTAQTVVRGVTHVAGEGVKTVSNGVGWVAGEVVANNPLALASRGLAAGADLIGQHDAAKVLGTLDRGYHQAGDLVHAGLSGVGQFEGNLVEGVGRVVADPLAAIRSVGTAIGGIAARVHF